MNIVKSLVEPGLFTKDASETIENKAKWRKIGFFSMLLCKVGDTLLVNLFAEKGVIRTTEGLIRAQQDF